MKSRYLMLVSMLIAALFALSACGSTEVVDDPKTSQQSGLESSNNDDEDCVCADIYAPVCGEDRQTYGNQCEADCAQVDVVAEGECDASDNSLDGGEN